MSRYCLHCGKSLKACICQWIQPLKSEVELIILQHPSEKNRAKGTAPILSLSIESTRVYIGEDFTEHQELNQLLADPDAQHYILYPGESSIDVEEALMQSDKQSKTIRVILLDGTWKKAFKIWKVSTNLHALPQIKLPTDLTGNYRIRKAPSENSLSTVEAGYQILSLLQPDQDFTPLVDAFDKMIEQHISHIPKEVYQRNYRS